MSVDDELGARLAAFLDGESDAAERQEVEALIARDPAAARALMEMREARDLLLTYDAETVSTDTVTMTELFDLDGREVDHFVVECSVGRGGMGQVYRAREPSLERHVALKIISPAVAATPQLVDRFVREARVQAGIDHPHVAHIYHVGTHEGRLYFAMEYLPGGSLEDRLRDQGRLDPEEAIDTAVEVADMLASTRERGIVHRDLKPSNIMFTEGGSIKLTDFGIAKPTDDDATELTQSGAVLGTPHYISPEAAAGGQVTWKSDMYSLGCVLYRLLFGRPPFAGRNAVQTAVAHVQAPFPEPAELPEGVSAELVDVVRIIMAKDPEDRFADYPSLIEALNSARPRIIEPISPWRRLGIGVLDALVTMGVGTIVIAAVLGAVGLQGKDQGGADLPFLLWGLVAVVCFGIVPVFSGSTLVQGVFAMKVRPERLKSRSRWVLFCRGLLANPLACIGVLALALALVPGEPLTELTGLAGVVAIAAWTLADLASPFIDKRKRFLHDIVFGTRLQYVTYRD